MSDSTANTVFSFFFFNDTATTEIYTLFLHDALPISPSPDSSARAAAYSRNSCVFPFLPMTLPAKLPSVHARPTRGQTDRKSTRLNSSHANISYAVFCLKKKKLSTRVSYQYYVYSTDT